MRSAESVPTAHLFARFEIQLGTPIVCGASAKGERRIVPILGGRVTSAYFSGSILSGGSDWQMVVDGGITELDARYVVETTEGEYIAIHNGPSFRYGGQAALTGLLAGEKIDPAVYYSCGNPQFDTGIKHLQWINYHRFVGKSTRMPSATIVTVYNIDEPMAPWMP